MAKQVQKTKKKEKEIEEVIKKVKEILRQLHLNTFYKYREAGQEILKSGYNKGEWHSEHREKALEEWAISQQTFNYMTRLGEMSDQEFTDTVSNFSSVHIWAHKGIEEKIEERKRQIEELFEKTKHLKPLEGKYHVIVVDPPWNYNSEYNPISRRGITPYPTMDIEQIKDMELPTYDDCVLWLWTTNAFIDEAFDIIVSWGFEPKTVLTWVKNKFGVGYWLRGQTEHCILAVKGKPVWNLTNQSTVLFADVREHSEKPDEFYELVDSVCYGRKLDYFGTKERQGWDVYGTMEHANDE